jgi:hypothetical protein
VVRLNSDAEISAQQLPSADADAQNGTMRFSRTRSLLLVAFWLLLCARAAVDFWRGKEDLGIVLLFGVIGVACWVGSRSERPSAVGDTP